MLDTRCNCAYNTRVGTGSGPAFSETSAIVKNFAHTRKKDLTSLVYYCIIGAGFLLRCFTTVLWRKDLGNLKKFCATPQKRLDISRFCTHNGAEQTLYRIVTLLLAPARRPGNVKPHRSGFFRGVFHVEHHSSRSQSRVISARMPARLSL